MKRIVRVALAVAVSSTWTLAPAIDRVSAAPEYVAYPMYPALDPQCGSPASYECIPWSFKASGASTWGTNMEAAWAHGVDGTGIVVAVLDTGTTVHPDLAGNLLPGYDFVSNSTTANDGDGRDSNPSDRPPPDGTSAQWHGTHVMGTVAAIDNTTGVKGGAYGAKILPVRVLGNKGGSSADVIAGIRWAADIGPDPTYGWLGTTPPSNPNKADIINLSLGVTAACDDVLQQAIDDAVAAGVVVVAAAGNSSANASGFSPANCDNVITVAATDQSGARASSFSNWGPLVELSAPGVAITSTYNSGTISIGSAGYANLQGTSMAAPHVSAAAALLLDAEPTLTPAQVSLLLVDSVSTFSATPSCAVTPCSGSGILDVDRAVSRLVDRDTLVASPTLQLATKGSHSVTVTWQPGAAQYVSLQSSATDWYEVKYGSTVLCTVPVGDPLTCTHSGLVDGVDYSYAVVAHNLAGYYSTAVRTGKVRFGTAPEAPATFAMKLVSRSVTVSWTPPSYPGDAPVSAYFVGSQPGGTTMVGASARSKTYSYLTRGRAYTFSVTAYNGLAFGPARSGTVRIPILRRSYTLATIIIPPPSGSTNRYYSATGRCSKSGSYIRASAYTGTCRVTLRYVLGGVTKYANAYVSVV